MLSQNILYIIKYQAKNILFFSCEFVKMIITITVLISTSLKSCAKIMMSSSDAVKIMRDAIIPNNFFFIGEFGLLVITHGISVK